MLISCNKLKKYIKNSDDIDFEKVWDRFSIRTAEVEGVTKVGNTFDGVVIAQIKTCEAHPDSDHMHILTVDYGKEEPIQVVCGAPNVRVNLKTAFIQVGGHIDGMEITARPLRGVVSNGMCCSGRELSISENHEGILELPDDAPVGMDIKKYLPIEDIIVEIDNKSLTNRPDLWGHYGIAREIAAITDHELLPLDLYEITNDKEDLNIKINNPELCYRYCGLTIDNIKNNVTPLDMQIFLYYVGMRSISLLVDLTNYLMLELGQPMHAFDKRVVKSIEVGLAKDGDTYTTLDSIERKLTNNTLMIKNADKYFAIAGVMGGLDSEILEDTDSLFLESATFNAGSIRKTAVALGLRTEASSRYEKALDPNMADVAIKRFVYLLAKENPNLVISSNLTDVYPTKLEEGHISLFKETLKTYMGKYLEDEYVVKTLEKIGFKVETTKESYEVTVPTFRHSKDVNIQEDLIEEIGRFYGFENFKAVPLKLEVESHAKENVYNEEYKIKYLLASKYDLHEVHSYLWYDTNMLKELGVNKDGVKLLDKSENNILRDDLSFSLLNIVNNNFKNYSKFGLFEIGTIIKNGENKRVLSIVLANEDKYLENAYNLAKSIIKYVFRAIKNKEVVIDSNSEIDTYYDKNLAKRVLVDNEQVATINVLNKNLSNKISKKKSIVCIDIDFDKYLTIDCEKILATSVSKYPTVELDYTVVLENGKKYNDLNKALVDFRSNIIIGYKLVGVYENKYTVRYTLGSNHKTLEQKDIQNFKDRFMQHIKDNDLLIME